MGVAKAALGRALQKVGGVEVLTSRARLGNPAVDLEPSGLDAGVTERIEATPTMDIDGKGNEIGPSVTVLSCCISILLPVFCVDKRLPNT